MIISFKCNETEKIWHGEKSYRLPSDIQLIARRKLRMLDAACALKDLMVPPANRLKPLKGDLINRYSLRINDQWRLVFIGMTIVHMRLKLLITIRRYYG